MYFNFNRGDDVFTNVSSELNLAEADHVGINELHRYLIDLALTQIEDGTHTLQTQSTQSLISMKGLTSFV